MIQGNRYNTRVEQRLLCVDSRIYLIGLASIIVLGILAQWVAWRVRLPAILLLLLFGFLAGPFSEWLALHGLIREKLLDPDRLLNGLLLPLVSLSVGVILFEGGLTLNIAELRQAGQVILKLVSIGAAVTWLVATAAARVVLGLGWPLAVLLGAILVVTGPTVIGPLLRSVRPTGPVGAVLKWEGIVIDPIGALLAVLVFEAIPANLKAATTLTLSNTIKTVVVGGSIGVAAAGLLVMVFQRHWTADYLHNPMTLALVVAAFAASNLIQAESGLFAVTIMGIVLANQKNAPVRHILEFKENLAVLLVSGLFILLASRLRVADVARFNWRIGVFVAVLILIARPLAVALSTIGSRLSIRERVFLACMAPRGIVAASVSSVFAIRLRQAGYPEADLLGPYTFAVIIGTVSIYGLLAGWSAQRLGLANPARRGFLVVGANRVARMIALAVRAEGYDVLLADTNRENLEAARREGLPILYGSVLSQYALEKIELSGIARLLALTSNEEVNSLAALHFSRVFGRSEVYQLATGGPESGRGVKVTAELRGRPLFGQGMTYQQIDALLQQGAAVRRVPLTGESSVDQRAECAIPLFLVDETGQLSLCTTDVVPSAREGQVLAELVVAAETSAQ